MKTTIGKVKEWIERQLGSYEKHPYMNEFERGHKAALKSVLELIKKDGRYK